MADEEIDTSDIPPLADSFFENARWRLPRLYIYRRDFSEARNFAAHILAEGYHKKNSEKRNLVHRALDTSVIMAYARAFTQQRDLDEKREPTTLAQAIAEVLTDPDAKRLHDIILHLRDKVYAHSDSSKHELPLDYHKYAPIMKVNQNLTESDMVLLKTMIDNWIRYVDDKISILKNR